jgi:hypothetical protein
MTISPSNTSGELPGEFVIVHNGGGVSNTLIELGAIEESQWQSHDADAIVRGGRFRCNVR